MIFRVFFDKNVVRVFASERLFLLTFRRVNGAGFIRHG